MSRTVIISDCHIGAVDADTGALRAFLSTLDCDRLVVAGDLWELWTRSPSYLAFHFGGLIGEFRRLKGRGVALAYLLGNHDETYLEDPLLFLELMPVVPARLELAMPGGRLAIIHGHEYDHLIKWHYPLMRAGYWVKQALCREKKNSISSKKHDVKYSALVGEMHYKARKDYQKLGFTGLIMGHTHYPVLSESDGFTFVNAGDWKGSNTFVEIEDGRVELKSFKR